MIRSVLLLMIGTSVSRRVTVTLRDLDQYPALIAAVMASEVTSMGSVQMGVSKDNELLDRAQVQALADARARAERLAAAQNVRLGKVYSISEFSARQTEAYELNPQRSLVSPSDGAVVTRSKMSYAEPLVPGIIEAQARVFVVFLLEN